MCARWIPGFNMTTSELGRRIAGWVDRRIEEMLAAPRMWGTGFEAVELQVLTLLQVRAVAVDIARELAAPRRILDGYVALLAERFGVHPPRPVHALVGEDEEGRFVEIVRTLVAALRDPDVEHDDDAFFSRAYVGIELKFSPGQFISAQTVTSFYEDFRRATRSLARVGSGRTGRVEKAIEVGTDFELQSVQVSPQNGVPACARIALGPPYGQLTMRTGDRVREALGQILDVVERADQEGAAAVLDFGRELDADTRTRVLVQTLRVLPRGGIEEVRIGGEYVARQPVELRRVHAPKVMEAVAQNTAPTFYDHTALIRAIDLDRGSISHGNGPRARVVCYVPAALGERVTRVGVRARIVGRMYSPHDGQPFVIAEEIDVLSDRADAGRMLTDVS